MMCLIYLTKLNNFKLWMISFLSSVLKSNMAQDSLGVARGLYRVAEGYQDPLNRAMYPIQSGQPTPLGQKLNALKETLQNVPTRQKAPFEFNENNIPESSVSRAMNFGALGVSLASSAMYKYLSSNLVMPLESVFRRPPLNPSPSRRP